MCVSVLVHACAIVTSTGVHPAPLPAPCHPVPPKSDRQRQTHCQRPQISYSLSTHPSVHMCHPCLESIFCLYISLTCSLCLSFILSHTLINAKLCIETVNIGRDMSAMLCFMQSAVGVDIASQNAAFLQPCITVEVSSPDSHVL